MSLHVTFFCDPETAYWEDGGPVGPTPNDMRDELITKLMDLRQQGRLQFFRYDPESRTYIEEF